MIYTFIKEDLLKCNENNQLFLQASYAKKYKKYAEIDLNKNILICKDIYADDKAILRCSCDNFMQGTNVLKKYNVNILEDITDFKKVEEWYKYNLTKRKIYELSFEHILNGTIDEDFYETFKNADRLFIKSKCKGFSCTVSLNSFLCKNEILFNYLADNSKCFGDKILITEELEISKDSLGKKEYRCLIKDGRVINVSRYFNNLVHNVTKRIYIEANEIAEKIEKINNFPYNYVLDIAEFIKDGEKYIDIVELNPISTSSCYINNSIFFDEIENSNKYDMGVEFFYDYKEKKNKYVINRFSNMNYEIIPENHVVFEF